MPLRPSPLASLKQQNTSSSVVCSNRLRFPSRLTTFAATVYPQLSRWPPLVPRHVRSPAPTSLTLPRATDLARPQTSSLRVRSDFHFTSWGLIVSVKWSKVIQFRERTLLIPLVSIPSHALCPVHALRDFFDTCPAPASSPAFVLPTATGLRSISYSSFTKHLKDLLRLAGLNPDNYSGHSFRRGGATYASSLGIPHELIQLQGDWVSTAYLEYLARPLRQRLSLAQTVASQLGSSTSPT